MNGFVLKVLRMNAIRKKMVRLILLFALMTSSLSAYSQLDTIHYLPPLFARVYISQHYISVSTLSNTNVTVDIRRGDGTLIQNTTITATTPALVLLGVGTTSQGIVNEAGLNSINTNDGIIVKSSQPTFVNIRHVQTVQGLCLSSKGRFAFGTNFRSGHIYNNAIGPSVKAHQISVMATKDNTVVNFLDFSTNVKFKNTPAIGNTSNPITVTLDKGESYVIAAYADEPGATGNLNDVNGTQITANKAIVVNSGSWLGGGTTNGRDIGIDQIAPIEVLGTEYVFAKGTGPAANERPCVVAEYNNTQIFVNGGIVPLATINSGDYYYILDTAFAANGNIYVRTSEPSYIYQSLSGTDRASNGLSFIPPIRCDGSKKVIIPHVNLVGIASISITARTGASVYVNGSVTPITGALPVTGNASWVTYGVPGGTGIFSVSSDSVINVALLTLHSARGSAGYFSGFASLQETSRGDSADFILCQNSASSHVKINIAGPYSSITPTFIDPSLGGSLIVNSTVGDSISYTYTNLSPLALVDTVELEICKISSCSGTIVDTICTIATLVFTKFATLNPGVGDSIIVCQDTSSIDLLSVLSGSPQANGIWIDNDLSGLLFNGSFQTNIANPGVYHYTYLVNGPLTCFDSSEVIINVLPYTSAYCCPIDPSFLIQNINCNGASTGFIQILDTTATQFSVDGGATYQNSGTFSNLAAGTYPVRAEFGPNCIFDTIIILTQPNPLSAIIQSDSTLCNSTCNGEISIAATGGTGPYNFLINGLLPQTSPLYTGLCVGTYAVTINDVNNCTINQNVIVSEPPILTLVLDTVTFAACSSATGSILISAQGGIPSYMYSIDSGPFQSDSLFSSLVAGTYNITVSDSNNCTDQMSVIVNTALGPTGYLDSLVNVTCFSDSSGLAIIGANGGTGPYQYSLSMGPLQNSNVFDSLIAGNYTVNITDDNGCDGLVNFVVTEPTPLLMTYTSENALCFNSCDGLVQLDVTGSNPPYVYSLNSAVYSPTPFNQFDTILNICSGSNLILNVKDSSECIVSALVNILEPDSIEFAPVITNPTCFDACNGEILMQPIGGTGNFEFSIDNGVSYFTSNQFLNLCENTYNLSVRDSNLCINTDTISLISPPEFQINTISVVHTTCLNSDGSIQIEIDNPVNPNYTFTNTNTGSTVINSSTATFSNLSSGVYEIIAIDNSGCIDTVYIGLSDSSLTANVDTASITHIDCFGLCAGSFSVMASGGKAPYLYSINNGLLDSIPSFTGLCAGQYAVLVEDDSGCVETFQVEIFEPDELSFLSTNSDIDCFGDCSGEINFINNSGGVPPYNFSIDNGVSFFLDSNFIGLCDNQYNMILRDSNNCEISSIQQISENAELIVIQTTENGSCNGSADGLILFAVSGGVPTYQYSIDDGITFSTSSSFTGLNAGTYLIQIRDSENCFFYDTIVISEPLQNSLSVQIVENLCPLECNGEIAMNAAGGTLPYQYTINGGTTYFTTSTFSNLCSGQYQIEVMDGNNCVVSILDSLMFIDTLAFSTIITNSNCNLPTGSIGISAVGGTPNYLYSIDSINYNSAPLFANLSAGSYNVYLSDANNCTVSQPLIINNFTSPQIDSIQETLPCHGVCNGALTVYASGGNNTYEYSLDGSTFQTSNQFLSVCGGNYLVTVRDGNGCSNTINYNLIEPDTISFTAIVNPILCYGIQNGSINISAQGGIGQLSYVFNAGAATTVTNYPQLGAGNYSLQIIDEIGCLVQFDTVLIEPSEIQITFNEVNPTCFGQCNGSLEAVVSGGTLNNGAYNYSWSITNLNIAQLNNICSGLYSLVVQDSNGCIADSINFNLTQPLFPVIDSAIAVGVDCFGSPAGSSISVYTAAGNFLSFDGGQSFGVNTQLNNISTGQYWIQIQDGNNCPGDSVSVFVSTPQLLVAFIGPDAIVCPGELKEFTAIVSGGTAPYQYSWNNGNTQSSFFENVNANGTYYVEVIDANGCSFSSDVQNITLVLPPVITTSNDTVICAFQPLDLWASTDGVDADYSFNWSVAEIDTNYYITPSVYSDTVFYIEITDECNLITVDSINIAIFIQPELTLHADSIYGCVPHVQEYKVDISQNTIIGNITWNNSLGNINSSDNDGLIVSYVSPGFDYLTANYASVDGCLYEVNFNTYINISPSPIANFSISPTNPNNYDEIISFKNESVDYMISNWSIENQTFNTTDAEIVLETIDNLYTPFSSCLEVSNAEGCSNKICKYTVVESDQLIFVPNAFTPGSGSINSIFKADGTNIDIYQFHMIIFNRWGEIVFESYDINSGWDGTYAGNILPTAVFTWKIDVGLQSEPQEITNLVGQVILIR